jgi:hypothetical protein
MGYNNYELYGLPKQHVEDFLMFSTAEFFTRYFKMQ